MKISKKQERKLQKKVFEAVGRASVCWDPKPEGEFLSGLALEVGCDLLTDVKKLVNLEIAEAE